MKCYVEYSFTLRRPLLYAALDLFRPPLCLFLSLNIKKLTATWPLILTLSMHMKSRLVIMDSALSLKGCRDLMKSENVFYPAGS